MDPVPQRSSPRPRARERSLASSCASCGQAFTVHYMSERAKWASPSGVPCINDACGSEVRVLLPAGAFAVWIEEM
jgi:hypothetical protein